MYTNGRKMNVWSTNKYSNELHPAGLCTEEGTLNVTETAVCNSIEY